ncbi:hypothetical protein TIFTF001_027854 [Ficus carica]|uniref:Uncharacterized protein n=1 Tax=Ficus carica TaxID=3494 RepID=A0AA88DP64_FICCA|nr:hypothetical protein TIFTF001_027854 [Ficus carica]
MTTPKVYTFLVFPTGMNGPGQVGLKNQQVQGVLVGFPDRPDRSWSGRSGKPASSSVLTDFPDRPDRSRSCRSGKPATALALALVW